MKDYSSFETGIGELPQTVDPFRGVSYVGGKSPDENLKGVKNMENGKEESEEPQKPEEVEINYNANKDNAKEDKEDEENMVEIGGEKGSEYQEPIGPEYKSQENIPEGNADEEVNRLYDSFMSAKEAIEKCGNDGNLESMLKAARDRVNEENKSIEGHADYLDEASEERNKYVENVGKAYNSLTEGLKDLIETIGRYFNGQTKKD